MCVALEHLFDYDDFRKFLQDYFEEQKKMRAVFSHRFFADIMACTAVNFVAVSAFKHYSFAVDAYNSVLDFNGSRTESVARFYAGFGAERYTYPALNFCNNPLLALPVKFYKFLRNI